jgi:hypothetical protein
MKNCFEQLSKTSTIWDITATSNTNSMVRNANVSRVEIKFSQGILSIIGTKYSALKLQNANGGDLFLYPGFIVMQGSEIDDFGIIDYRDVNIKQQPCQSSQFSTLQEFYDLVFYTNNGLLHECYEFNNPVAAQAFAKSFLDYKTSLQNLNWQTQNKTITFKNSK